MPDYRPVFRLRPGRRAALRRELDEELRTHIELRVEELIRRGLTPEEARAEAERRFGDLEGARRALYASARRREARLDWRRLIDALSRDVRLAFRRIVRAPTYSAVSVCILSLGIAITTVMFAVFDGVLLRPLPFPEADLLVSLQSVGEQGAPYDRVSMANWHDWRAGTTTLAATGLSRQDRLSVRLADETFRVTGTAVGGDFFEVFRPRLVAGRALVYADGQEVRLVTVLSSSFASRHFGSAQESLGRTLSISGRPYEVVGVLDDRDAFPERTDLWVAFHVNPGSGAQRNNINFQAYARLQADADLTRTRAELDAVARGIRDTDPEGAFHSHGVHVTSLHQVVVADTARTLWLLMATVAAVLLVVCANLAGLGLARARRRAPEVAVRLALGSGRGPIVRELLIEYLGVAALAGLLAIVIVWSVEGLLLERLSTGLPRSRAIALDLRVALFAAAVTVGSGLLAGLVPAVRASRAPALSVGRRAVRGGGGLPGGVLVGAEVALALAILIGGGLLFRSLHAVVSRDLGYDPDGVFVTEIDLNGEEYRSGTLAVEYWRVLLDDLHQIPGVRSAAVANWIPTGPGGTSFLSFPHDPEPDFGGGYRVVSERYFETLGIALHAGRDFTASDDLGTERVTMVNRAMADRAWPDQNPIGQRLAAPSMEGWMYEGAAPWLTVIGVVDDVRHDGHESDVQPELYVLHRQVPRWARGMTVVVRGGDADPASLGSEVGVTIRASDPSLAVEVERLDRRVTGLLRERVVTQRILAGFGLAALLLVCLGIYGLVSHAASQRTREMAVRAALGARQTGLLRLMLVAAGRVIAAGTAVGLVVAYGLAGLVDSLLVDVPARDPLTFVGAAALIGLVGLLAGLVPSVQAARMDPIEALRTE
jgi:predicted permease